MYLLYNKQNNNSKKDTLNYLLVNYQRFLTRIENLKIFLSKKFTFKSFK